MKTVRILAMGLAACLLATGAQAQGGGGRPGGGRFGGGGALQLLGMMEVQKELKLDEAAIDLIKQLGAEQQTKMRELFQGGFQGGDRAAMMQKMEAMRADEMKKVGEILDAKQMGRLKQLMLQQAGARALTQKETQDGLKLTAEQKTNIANIQKAEQDATQALFQSLMGGGGGQDQRGEMFRKMTEMRQQNETKLLGVLTPAQKTMFEQMKGAAFKFPERQPRRPNN